MKKNLSYLFVIVIGLAFIVGPSNTALAGDFYKGKTIRFVVGYSPGGGYDTYTRFVARHIGKYIPGSPTPIVQNMTGAGSLIAANYLNNRARPDGLTVGVWNSAHVLSKALGDRSIRFDPKKTKWIGTPSVGLPTCSMMAFTGLTTLKDVMKSGKRIKMGATRGGTLNAVPKILNKTLGTKFDVISGYRGTATIRVALQKRELDGACWGWESQRVTARSMLDAKGDDKFIPILTHGSSQDPELQGLPRLTEVIKGKENLALVNTWLQQYNFQRPFSLPPGTPQERVNILRKAFKAAVEDPELLAEAKKSKLLIDYVSGKQVVKYVDQILAITPQAKEGLQFLVVQKKKKKS
ncbi:MAG: Bug family tripartite tricarboxylate transporter substrate binding protein [Candidatus Binatia bacterium]